MFKGSGYPGMMTFIKHCNDQTVTEQISAQLDQREKPRFKKTEKKEDFIEEHNTKKETPKKNKLKSQWDRLTR